jgi:HemY protein
MNSFVRILIVFVVLLIFLVISAMVFDDRGYVFIEFIGYAIEMNVMSLAITVILIFSGLQLFNWFINATVNAASGSRSWLGNIGLRKKQTLFKKGLIALAENNYLAAKEALGKIENDDFDGINLLAAAQVEMQLDQPQAAKALWFKAAAIESSSLAANLCLIRDALQNNQGSAALTLIASLSEKQRHQSLVIKLWAQALAQAGLWQELKTKLPGWKKALGQDYDALTQQASSGNFAEIASKEGAAQLMQNWQSLPRSTRKDPGQQAAYIQQLIDQGMHSDAEKALVEYQKSGPHPLLVPLFKKIKLPNPTAAMKKIESWLKQDDSNVDLLSALGHLAYYSNDKALAERALSRAIKLGNKQQDLRLMAQLKESQHDQVQALALYKKSLDQSDKTLQDR